MEVFDNSLKVGAPHEITTIEKLASSVAKGQGTLEGYHITEEDEMTSQDYGLDDPNQRQYNQPSDLSNEQPERNPLQDGISTEEERLREFHRTQQFSNFGSNFQPAPNFTSGTNFGFQPQQPYQSWGSSSLGPMSQPPVPEIPQISEFEQFQDQNAIVPIPELQQFQPPTQNVAFKPQHPKVRVERDYYDFQSPLYEDQTRIDRQYLATEESNVQELDITGVNLENDVGINKLQLRDGKLEQKVGFLENTFCDLTDNEKLTFIDVFRGWTGIEYDDHTEEDMLDELNNVKVFLKHDLSITLGLAGIMIDINQAMFTKELDSFNEQELMSYAILFHLDMQPLEDLQENLKVKYSTLYSTNGITEEELEEAQRLNLEIYLNQLKSIIINFKLWMIYRLRLWRWREEVLLGNVGLTLESYPGLVMMFDFESSADIMENGFHNYYMRVGEAKRETLMDQFRYFDLYHMFGKLSTAFDREVDFGTDTEYEDLADGILCILDEMEVDPRHALTPFGVRVIYNSEEGEVIYNLYKYQDHDQELLRLACTHAGIDIMKDTVMELEDGTTQQKRNQKPINVLVEELTSQYLSPQFYSGVESHRNYMSAVSSFKTLSGDRLTNAEESDIIFYGIGDGLSTYRVYRPRELVEVFVANKGFVDPYSIRADPSNPDKWSRFSVQSIKRLLRIVIPRLRVKSRNNGDIHTEAIDAAEASMLRKEKRTDLDELEEAIIVGLDDLDINDPETIDEFIKPRGKQARIIKYIKEHLEEIREPLSGFLTYMFNLGVQLSDWDEDMIRIDENAINTALITDPLWKYFDPETTANLTENIFMMLTVNTEKYINVRSENGEDFTRHIKALRLVKYYLNAYRIEWNDELATINGHLYRMIQANGLSYYNYVSISGNWLMATANYYSIEFFEQPMGNIVMGIVNEPDQIEDYVDDREGFEV